MRHLSPLRAFLASFFVAGLGYVYVGRIDLGIAVVIGTIALLAIPGWTRLILEPWAIYVIVLVTLLMTIGIPIHTVRLAIQHRNDPPKRYNSKSAYVFWTVCVLTLLNAIVENRGRFLGFEPFRLPSASMSPTLEPGDVFIIDSWRYQQGPPAFGEIVVFDTPSNPGSKYVKRIVGVPGDRVEIREGVLFRNDQPVTELYLHQPRANGGYGREIAAVDLGPSEFYVLGDFRDNSKDSRMWGPIPRNHIYGRVEYIWFSLWQGTINWQRFPRVFEW
jgi:signal peptidase I